MFGRDRNRIFQSLERSKVLLYVEGDPLLPHYFIFEPEPRTDVNKFALSRM